MAAMIIDAGPLVALLDRKDQHHPWAIETLRTIAPPMFMSEGALDDGLELRGAGATVWVLVGDAGHRAGELVRPGDFRVRDVLAAGVRHASAPWRSGASRSCSARWS